MLNYGLVSTAVAVEDRTRLLDGMRLLAGIAHKHRIPITWAVNTKSVPVVAKLLAAWHTEAGDAPLLMLDTKPIWEATWESQRAANLGGGAEARAAHLVTMRQKLPEYIIQEWRKINREVPWAEPNVAGAEFKNDVLLHALEQTGFRGLWGYHWGERGADTSDTNASEPGTDRGGFACFYPLEAAAYMDSLFTRDTFDGSLTSSFKNIVGIPYRTAGHLARNADNFRAALFKGTARRHFDIYVESTAWNQWIGYVEHISPLAVAQLGAEGLERLDAYLAHIVSTGSTSPLLLSQMVDDYMAHCEWTEPMAVIGPGRTTGCEAVPKSTLNLYYCDAACEFTFVEGNMEPVEIKNYTDECMLQSDTSRPVLTGFFPTRHRTELRIAITVESVRAMPYGITVWGDHGGLQLAASDADAVQWIGAYALFLRFTLQAGKNEFKLRLTI